MNGQFSSEPSSKPNSELCGWPAIGAITRYTQAANEAWQLARLPASAFDGDRRVTIEHQDWQCDVECLRAEIRHLKDELQRATQERDMLRNANRIIAVTVQAQQLHRRNASDKKHPTAARNRGRPARPR